MNFNYLKNICSIFKQYQLLGEKTFSQVADDQLLWQYNEESNSIAIIVNHMCGNMLSRWTNFLMEDGEKEWRNRDSEFEDIIHNRKELLERWEKGWNCLFAALNSLKEEDLIKTVLIRNEPHTVIEACNRQLAHYSSHVGQIIFIGKMVCGNNWKSLSILKGESSLFNQSKFDKPTP